MPTMEIGEKEKIQVLLTEYNGLRNESISRISSSYAIVSMASAVILWLLQQSPSFSFWIGLSLAVFGVLACSRMISYDVINSAKRVRELELEINKRAGERLLVWESERGGLNKNYWKKVFFLR